MCASVCLCVCACVCVLVYDLFSFLSFILVVYGSFLSFLLRMFDRFAFLLHLFPYSVVFLFSFPAFLHSINLVRFFS